MSYVLLTACASMNSETTSRTSSATTFHPSHLRCLAQAIHGEARGEPEAGKLLVGRVIATRLQYGYGKNYCDVVHARKQFAPQKHYSEASWQAAQKSHKLGPNGITHFHSYSQRQTPRASFSSSPQCAYRGKIGAHWTFSCNDRRVLSSIQTDDD